MWMNICHLNGVHAKRSYNILRHTHSYAAYYTPFDSIFNLIISTIAHALYAITGNGIKSRGGTQDTPNRIEMKGTKMKENQNESFQMIIHVLAFIRIHLNQAD